MSEGEVAARSKHYEVSLVLDVMASSHEEAMDMAVQIINSRSRFMLVAEDDLNVRKYAIAFFNNDKEKS